MKTKLFFLMILFGSQINAQVLGSINFDGTNNYIEVSDSPLNTIGNGDFTLEAWVNGDEAQQNAHPVIFSNRGNSINDGILFFFHNIWGGSQSKLLSLQIDGINYKFVNNGTFNGSLLDNTCRHVAVTRKGNELSFYADGVLFGTVNTTSSATTTNNEPLLIGKDEGTNNTFNGILSQCRIWNIARSESEILESKDISLEGDEAGLLAYWEMNDETGQVVSDKTNQYDGQLGNQNDEDEFDPTWSTEGCVELVLSNDDDDFKSNTLSVFPNPTSDLITIHSEVNSEIQIQIISQTGRVVRSINIRNGINEIDLSQLPAGIYFLHATSNENSTVKKILKV